MQKVSLLLVVALVAVSCGDSAETATTSTTATAPATTTTTTVAPTSTTSAPTTTTTVAPIDLVVEVVDEAGSPVAGAEVTLVSMADDGTLVADEFGRAVWRNISETVETILVSVSGYFAFEAETTLAPGRNELLVSLVRDPFGVLDSQTCLPDEHLIYVEDFQDGLAQSWSPWSIEPAPTEPGNRVAFVEAGQQEGADFNGLLPADLVFRAVIQVTGHGEYNFFVYQSAGDTESGDSESRYMAAFGTRTGGHGPQRGGMARIHGEAIEVVDRWFDAISIGDWHLIEVAVYGGEVTALLDGETVMNFVDEDILPAGGLGVGVNALDEGARIYYDNLVVCGLDAPVTSMYETTDG